MTPHNQEEGMLPINNNPMSTVRQFTDFNTKPNWQRRPQEPWTWFPRPFSRQSRWEVFLNTRSLLTQSCTVQYFLHEMASFYSQNLLLNIPRISASTEHYHLTSSIIQFLVSIISSSYCFLSMFGCFRLSKQMAQMFASPSKDTLQIWYIRRCDLWKLI